MFSPGPLEIGLIFLIILILFGPGKLPDVCRALGDGLRQFKSASKETVDAITDKNDHKKPAIEDKQTAAAEPKEQQA